MNFVFSIGYYHGYIDANCKIAVSVAKQFILKGHNCLLITYSFNIDSIQELQYEDITIKVIPANEKNHKTKQQLKESGLNKLLFSVLHPIKSINVYLNRKYDYHDVISYINDHINNDTYLVGFINPTDATYKIMSETNDCHKVIYQLDPWGLFETEDTKKKNNNRKKELELFKMCDYIFTTDILYRQYHEDKDYNSIIEKLDFLHFPNLDTKLHSDTVIDFDKSDYNVIYVGTIDDEVRNPLKILSMFSKLFHKNVKLYFIGNNNSDIVKEFSNKYPNNVFVLPCVSAETAQNIMNQDNIFLLNINNRITNMSPSKLIDYISTGNPIINVIKNKNDISEDILCRYNNCFSFNENDNDIESNLLNFLENNKNIKLDKNTIIKNYYEYTPEYVADKIIKVLKGEK